MKFTEFAVIFLIPTVALIISAENRNNLIQDQIEIKRQGKLSNRNAKDLIDNYQIDQQKLPENLEIKGKQSLEIRMEISDKNIELKNTSDLISESNKKSADVTDLLNKETKLTEEINDLNNKSGKIIDDIVSTLDEIVKSDISEYFFKFIDAYRNFVVNLEVDQLIALINVFGYYFVLIFLFNITIILCGDFIIDKLNLETKFPKIAKYIQLRKK